MLWNTFRARWSWPAPRNPAIRPISPEFFLTLSAVLPESVAFDFGCAHKQKSGESGRRPAPGARFAALGAYRLLCVRLRRGVRRCRRARLGRGTRRLALLHLLSLLLVLLDHLLGLLLVLLLLRLFLRGISVLLLQLLVLLLLLRL